MEQILIEFLDEAEERLGRIETACQNLEKQPSGALIEELFREFHSLKGNSKAVDLNDMANFVHQIEDMVSMLRAKTLPITQEPIQLLLKGHDYLAEWVELMRSESTESPETELYINQIIKVTGIPKHQWKRNSTTGDFEAF